MGKKGVEISVQDHTGPILQPVNEKGLRDFLVLNKNGKLVQCNSRGRPVSCPASRRIWHVVLD